MRISNQKYDERLIEERIKFAEDEFSLKTIFEEKLRFEEKREWLREKPQQVACANPDEIIGLECVQSFVSNMSTATSLEELEFTEGITLPENLIGSSEITWTSPKWAKAGDVVFFMHSKTARTKITQLRSELIHRKDEFTSLDFNTLMGYLEHALDIHSKYGGKVFAVGRVCGGPEYVEPDNVLEEIFHWKSRNYSKIDNIQVLDKPIDISDFNNYLYISRGSATTPLFDREFDQLRTDIGQKNRLPDYVSNAIARPIPLRSINSKNWIEVANVFRRCFILEKQFRQFYVDYLLHDIGDQKRFFTECRCQRDDISDSFMDYVICFEGKYLPVETKLAVSAEPNIVGQVSKYVHNTNVFLTSDGKRCTSGDRFHDGKVLIIDTERMYIYDDRSNTVRGVFDLDMLKSKEELSTIKQMILAQL